MSTRLSNQGPRTWGRMDQGWTLGVRPTGGAWLMLSPLESMENTVKISLFL